MIVDSISPEWWLVFGLIIILSISVSVVTCKPFCYVFVATLVGARIVGTK